MALRNLNYGWCLSLMVLACTRTLLVAAMDDKDVFKSMCTNDSLFQSPQPLAQRKVTSGTTVHLIGLFDVHEGSRCHILKPGGMEQMMMTIGILENRLLSLPDSTTSQIGFKMYDTCSNASSAMVHLIHALLDAKVLQENDEQKRYVQVLGPRSPDIQQQLAPFLKSLRIPFFPLMVTSLKEEIKALSEVLLDLKWMSVALFSSTKSLEHEFLVEAERRNICIASSLVLTSKLLRFRSTSFYRMLFHELSSFGIQVAVVLGSSINLQKLYEMAITSNSSIEYWLLAGVDVDDSPMSIPFGPDHPVILFKSSVDTIPKFDNSAAELYEFDAKINKLNLIRSYYEYVNSCSGSLNGSGQNDSRCEDNPLNSRNPLWTVTLEAVSKLMEDLSRNGAIDTDENNKTEEYSKEKIPLPLDDANETSKDVEIWTYQHAIGKFSKHKSLQVGHFSRGHLVWDMKRLNIFRFMGSGWFKVPEFHCQKNCDEVCINFDNITITMDINNFFSRIYYWKHETWVTVLLTTSCLGILISVLTMAFLITKSCRADFDEGTQVSNVILLIGVIFSYCCTLLFVFQIDGAVCSKRVNIVGIAYVTMLAPILSRCFVLISAEMDGIHGHVSGFIQSVLCFFILGVQIAMAAYHWLANTGDKYFRSKCIIDVKHTLVYLSYTMLLSVIWFVASPFSARSRRNNNEGLLLHFCSIAVCLVWLVWYLLFFLLHPRWNEFTICFGLVATATAIILVIFLPKVYRILISSAGKEHGQVGMQPVIFASCSSRSPNLSIYESINHGYNPDKDGYIVDVYRDEEESPGQRKMTHL